jgi:hypothetical protein
MFRAGIVGRSLQQSFQNISEKEVLDTLKDQVSELNENSNTLSSIETIAKRISNNVFALAKLMQKMYEMKVKEKLLRDRERSRQESLQEEARFESQRDDSATEKTSLARKIQKSNDRISTASVILGVGSLLAVAFKEEVTQFLKDAEKWIDDAITSAKTEFENLIDDGRELVDESISELVNEANEEISLNREEDLDTDKIEKEIVDYLQNEDQKLDELTDLSDEDEEERDVTDAVPRETQPPVPVSTPTVTDSSPSYSPSETEAVKPEPPDSDSSAEIVSPPPNVLSFIPKDNDGQITPSTASTEPDSSYAEPRLQSPIPPTNVATVRNADSQPLGESQPILRSLSNDYLTRNVSMPQMLQRSNLMDDSPNLGLGSILSTQSFGMPQSQSGGLSIPQSFDMPLTQPTVIQNNTPTIGSIIDNSSFLNRLLRTNPVSANNNTAVVTSGNIGAAKPQTDHYVPSPDANRGSLELGVRFNAAN